MSLKSSKKKLLPAGFRDILTNEANLQLNYANQLIKSFNMSMMGFEPTTFRLEV